MPNAPYYHRLCAIEFLVYNTIWDEDIMIKQIIILIGLKGSGKTYIGTLIQEKVGIKFFRVENVWLSFKSERLSNEYILEGFSLVEKEIDRLLLDTDRITIESTGTTDYFNRFINKLKNLKVSECQKAKSMF